MDEANIDEASPIEPAEKHSKKYDVMSIGNALMDILVKLEEKKFLTFGVEKSTMSLVSGEKIREIEDKLLGHDMTIEPGGASANTLTCLALLGCHVVFCGTVGTDVHGEIYEKKMTEVGVHAKLNKKIGITGKAMTFITPDSERTFAVHLGVAPKIGHEDLLEEDIRESKILYLTGYELEDELLRMTCISAMQMARKHGTSIAIDLADPALIKRTYNDLKNIVDQYADIILANEAEAKAYTGVEKDNAALALSKGNKLAIVKLGPEGSVICDKGVLLHVKSKNASAIDTTGAGDMYAAGILYGLAKKLPLERAAKLASFLGAKVVEKIGARLNKREINEITALMESENKVPGSKADEKAVNLISLGDNKFHALSTTEKGKHYLVDLNTNWCECPSFYYNKVECKHLKAAREHADRNANKK